MLVLRHSFYILLLVFVNFYLLIMSAYAQAWKNFPQVWMWILAFFVFSFCKFMTVFNFNVKKIKYPFAYLFCWPGMNPSPFIERIKGEYKPKLLRRSFLNILFGSILLLLARIESHWYLQSWLLCGSIVFFIHFGFINLIVVFLNILGFDVQPIMENPLRSISLKEFWGGRWNRAFNDLVVPLIYNPVKEKRGKERAMIEVFIFSGLVHELVISVSVWGGFGGPLSYFVIQAIGMKFEKYIPYKRAWMFFIVLVPAGLLFHPLFMKQAIFAWLK